MKCVSVTVVENSYVTNTAGHAEIVDMDHSVPIAHMYVITVVSLTPYPPSHPSVSTQLKPQ